MKFTSISLKYIFAYLIFFSFTLAYSQSELKLKNGYYKTFEDFIRKSPSSNINEPLQIKNRLGYPSFTLRNRNKEKVDDYFAVVQNDSILLKAKEVQKKLSYNKKVIFSDKKTDYLLVIGSNINELYFRQYNNSKSYKYIGFAIATPISVVFDFQSIKFLAIISKPELIDFLEKRERQELKKLLSDKKKLKFQDAIKVMEKYFNIEKTNG